MVIAQVVIAVFGIASIWLIGRKEKWRRWGYIFGLLTQPAWFYISYHSEQWGVFIASIFYTYSWVQGVYNYWINKKV